MNKCLTCKYWDEKARSSTLNSIEKYGYDAVMDLTNGFSDCGACDISYIWLDIDIDGDAYFSMLVSGNFGCIHYKPEIETQKH